VSRGAYFGGWFLGLSSAAFGFYLVAQLPDGHWMTIPLEMVVVGVALLLTTRIWKWSAGGDGDQLVKPERTHDGGGNE